MSRDRDEWSGHAHTPGLESRRDGQNKKSDRETDTVRYKKDRGAVQIRKYANWERRAREGGGGRGKNKVYR